MARDWTTTGLLATVKREAFLPDSGGPFTDAEILAVGDEATDEHMLPALHAIRGNHYVESTDPGPVASQAEYRIPARAVGGILRLVTWLDASGSGAPMSWYPLADRDVFGSSAYGIGSPPAFAVQGDHVVLMPTPTAATGTLRFYYYRRPGKMVPTSEAMQITLIAGSALSGSPPSTWGSTEVVDLIDEDPTFEALGVDAESTVTAGSKITTDDVPPSDLAVGDWAALVGETPIPQLPAEMHKPLARFIAADILESLGDQRHRDKFAKAQAGLKNVVRLLSPRVHAQARYAVNRRSTLRTARRSAMRWR